MYIYKLIAQNAHYFTFFFVARCILSYCRMFSKEFSGPSSKYSVIFFPTTCSQEKPIPTFGINSLIETTSHFEEQCTIHEIDCMPSKDSFKTIHRTRTYGDTQLYYYRRS